MEYRLRLNDVTHDVSVRFPNASDGVSQYTRDHTAFVNRMQEACAALVLKYATQHGLAPTKDEQIRLTRLGVYDDPHVDKRARDRTRVAIFDIVRPR